MAFKKKLYTYRPDRHAEVVYSHHTKTKNRQEKADPTSIERGIRQLLANKVSGNMMGLWLLVPEHLRLGTWDLLCHWCGQSTPQVQPRLALQLVHESALCVTGIRQHRALSQKGFELANGLPFVATDQAIHELLNTHTVAEAQSLQVHLGLLRRARGHFLGKVLAVDPHRVRSYTKRQTVHRQVDKESKPVKTAQTFFCLDADTKQPVCFTTSSSATSVSLATKKLLSLAEDILMPQPQQTMILVDAEHYTVGLIDHVHRQTPFDIFVPIPNRKGLIKQMQALPEETFSPRWAGFATTRMSYRLNRAETGPHWQLIQRSGETPDEYLFKAFLTTRDCNETDALTYEYPKRWHVEEFFKSNQALGWNRAGTLNLHIRYGQMSMALIAQALIHQLRQRLGQPYDSWDAQHIANCVLNGLDGDIRVHDDTILITFYNAPNISLLRQHFENLPDKLAAENINPKIPWLYGFKLDFRFK